MSHEHHHHGSMHEHSTVGQAEGEILYGNEHGTAHSEHMPMHNGFSLWTDSDFLIEGIKISSVQGIILAMIFTFVVTVVFEILKCMIYMRELHFKNPHNIKVQTSFRNQTLNLLVTAVSQMSSVGLAYIMMLCVMTMNVWLMVSVVLGSGIGHFTMRPLLARKFKIEYSRELEIECTIEEAVPLNELHDSSGNRAESENRTGIDAAKEALLDMDNL